MPALSSRPFVHDIVLPEEGHHSQKVPVVAVPLPKGTVGIVFGQRTALWAQRYNTYTLDTDMMVQDPQAVWDAPVDNSQFMITASNPPGVALDNRFLSVGPFGEDYYIAVYCSHKKEGEDKFMPSDPKQAFHEFIIGNKNAISVTMINAEDGGDGDYHDTVVGVSVIYTKK